MGRRELSVWYLLCRPLVLLLILSLIFLTKGIDVEVNPEGDGKAEGQILTIEDVSDVSPMIEEGEVKIRKQNGTRLRSRDRKRKRVGAGEAAQRRRSELGTSEEQQSGTRPSSEDVEDTKDRLEMNQIEEDKRVINIGSMEEYWSGTRSRGSNETRERVDEGGTNDRVKMDQTEENQRVSKVGTTEEYWSGTRSRGSNEKRERVDEGGTKDGVYDNEPPDEIANLDKEFRRLFRHDQDELLDLLINITYREHNSNISSSGIRFYRCGVGEYASVVRSVIRLDPSQMRVLNFYVNQHGEYRFYICKACRVCAPEAYEILPCLSKSDTVCVKSGRSVTCTHDDMVFDPNTGSCVAVSSSQPVVATEVEYPIAATTQQTLGVHFDSPIPGLRDSASIIDMEEDQASFPHSSSPLFSHPVVIMMTIITVGIALLNVFSCLIFRNGRRKNRERRFRRKHHRSETNNVSPTQMDGMVLARYPRNSVPSLPCISNEVDRRPTITASDLSPREIEMGRLSSSYSSSAASSGVPSVQVGRTKQSNLNVFHEPCYKRGAQTVSIPLPEDSNDFIQVLRGKDPFWLVMIGQFGPEGGILSCEDSDVILEIPPGAIPPNCRDQFIIARISLCPDSIGPKLKHTDSLWLSPLVELECPGLDRFDKNVKIRLPHRARVQSGWTFCVHYTDPTADTKCICQVHSTSSTVDQDPEAAAFLSGEGIDTKSKWNCLEQKWHPGKAGNASEDVTRVTFSVDEKYVNISTSHFSEYVCSGCSKTHSLNLEAVVYWQYYKTDGLDQMDLNVYIIDTIKDTRKASVESNERPSKQTGACSGRTRYSPLSLKYTSSETSSSLSIYVDEDSTKENWSLSPHNGLLPAKRVISVESVIRGCCSSLLSTQEMFSFNAKDHAERLSFFQAIICIKQLNLLEGNSPMPILVTVPLAKIPGTSGETVSDEQVNFVAERLQPSKWRPLYRKLMGKGATIGIQHIQARDPTEPGEQIHSALMGWKKSRGRMATVEKLITALEQVDLQDVADELQTHCQDQYTEEPSSATRVVVMETDL